MSGRGLVALGNPGFGVAAWCDKRDSSASGRRRFDGGGVAAHRDEGDLTVFPAAMSASPLARCSACAVGVVGSAGEEAHAAGGS